MGGPYPGAAHRGCLEPDARDASKRPPMTTAAGKQTRVLGALGLLVIMTLTPLPAAVGQVTFTVDSTHMTGVAAEDDPSPGSCDPGDCSLREAVIAANTSPGQDRITFDGPGVIALARVDAISETEATNDLDITDDVVIAGPTDGDTVAITPAAMSGVEARVFDVQAGTALITDLLLRDGESTTGGGAVRVREGAALALGGMTFRTNRASIGGAIHVDGGELTVEDSTFDRNGANSRGGAIATTAAQALDVSTSVFEGNAAGRACCQQTAASGSGGAISLDGATGPATLDQSTFTRNVVEEDGVPGGQGGAVDARTAVTVSNSVFDTNGGPLTAVGGAVSLDSAGPTVSEIINTTLAGNAARTAGGGLFLSNGSLLQVGSSTVARNLATADDGGRGGGISVGGVGAVLQLTNTTISGNQSSLGGGGIHIADDQLTRSPASVRQPATLVELTHATVVDNGGSAAIASQTAGSRISVASTIIAAGRSANCFTPEPGQLESLGHNLESADQCNLDQTTDLPGTDPMIRPLAEDSGVPQGAAGDRSGEAHALRAGSPAIDAADPDRCPDPIAVDQRGVPRPQQDHCDIGAYELIGAFDLALAKSVSPRAMNVGETATFTLAISNPSPSTPGSVVVTDVVPDGLSITAATATQGSCEPPAGQTLTCALGEVEVDATVMVTVAVRATTAATYTNTATTIIDAGAGDDDPENNAASATLVVQETGVGCSGGTSQAGPTISDGITRIDGLNRIQTAIASSLAACGAGDAPAVVLTRSDLFPDAQAGTPLAVSLGAPLLLSQPDSLSVETEDEIRRVLLDGGTVYLLGGEVALSTEVEQRLADLGYGTVRYAGQNRFETATTIAEDGLGSPSTVLVADGGDFADSIVAGAASAGIDTISDTEPTETEPRETGPTETGPTEAASAGAAILLTSDITVPPETRDFLARQVTPPTVIAIGAAAATAFPDAEAVSGPTRFETAVAVAERFFETPTAVGIARADAFPDGLSGGALVGRPIVGPGPIILTASDALPSAAEGYLTTNADTIERALIFGGTAAVDAEVEMAIAAALGL